MKVLITTDGLYPVFFLHEDLRFENVYKPSIDIPDSLYKEYKEAYAKFFEVQGKLEKYWEKRP